MKNNAYEYPIKNSSISIEDSVKGIQAIFIANIFLIFLVGFPKMKTLLEDVNMQACLFTAILFWVIYQVYDWKSKNWNIFFVSLYLLIFGIELAWTGLPDTLYPLKGDNLKGAMLDIFVIMLPIVYILLRFFFVLPLIKMFTKSKKLRKLEQAGS